MCASDPVAQSPGSTEISRRAALATGQGQPESSVSARGWKKLSGNLLLYFQWRRVKRSAGRPAGLPEPQGQWKSTLRMHRQVRYSGRSVRQQARPLPGRIDLKRESFDTLAAKMTIVGDRRFIPDRRTRDEPGIHDRRVRPDRRLNSIIVEWIPGNEVLLQPSLFRAYMKTKTRK